MLEQNIINKYRIHSLKTTMGATMEFLKKQQIGDLTARLERDIKSASVIISDFLPNIINVVVVVIVMLSALFYVNFKLLVAFILPIPLIFLSQIFGNNFFVPFMEKLQKSITLRDSKVKDILNNRRYIKAYQIKDYNSRILNEKFDNCSNKFSNAMMSMVFSFSPSIVLNHLPTLLVIGVGANLYLSNEITIESYIICITISSLTAEKLFTLNEVMSNIFNLATYAKKVFLLWDVEKEFFGDYKDKRNSNSIVSFRNINFSYEKKNILKNISFEIKKGEKVAIVGESGSGKSTIFDIILGFIKINNGKVKVWDENIENWDLKYLRENVAVVNQEVYLYPTTVVNNITLFNDNIDILDVEKVIEEVDLTSMIESMPNKINTLLSENSSNISGGQKQRLAIARAILKNSDLLLLDESTSALDSISEENIYNLIDKYYSEKTVISIIHKLEQIDRYDKIIFLNNGEVVSIGSFNKLIENCELFKNFVNSK